MTHNLWHYSFIIFSWLSRIFSSNPGKIAVSVLFGFVVCFSLAAGRCHSRSPNVSRCSQSHNVIFHSTPLPEALTVVVGETNSGVPVIAVLPVICNPWPNLAWRGRTKGVRQQIAAGTKQKPTLLMRQKACGSPTNPQELPNAAQTKAEIKKSQRQAHFYSRAKMFPFHGLSGFPVWVCNRAEKLNHTLTFSVTDFEKARFPFYFFLLFF